MFGGFSFLQRLKEVKEDLKRNIEVYQLALKDPRTPRSAKVILAIALGYALLPIDLVPDFIPIVGHIDDVIVVPGLILLATKLIPDEVMDDCRLQIDSSSKAKVARPRRRKRRR